MFVRGRAILGSGLALFLVCSMPWGAAAGVAPSNRDPAWVSLFPGVDPSLDSATAIGTSPDGSRVFVTGVDTGAGTDEDFATIAYDALSGHPLWAQRYNGPGNGNDFPLAQAVSPDGSMVFVAGNVVEAGGDWDGVTFAYDALTGTLVWTQSYGTAGSFDTARALAVSADGSTVYVTGSSQGTSAGTDFTTAAYEATSGAPLWLQRYDERESEEAEDIALSPDGSKVFVTGVSGDQWSKDDYLTVAHDAESGAVLWAQRYDGTGAMHDDAHSIAASSDGSKVFVTGESDGDGTGSPIEFATIAYDASFGTSLWVSRYRRTGDVDASAYSVAVGPSASQVFVAGMASPDGLNGSADRVLAYDAQTGSVLWEGRYHGPWYGANRIDDLAVSADGSTVFAAGLGSGPADNADSVTLAYEAQSGTQRWALRFAGPGRSDAWTPVIAVSADASRIWLAGKLGHSYTRILTLAYDVSGDRPPFP